MKKILSILVSMVFVASCASTNGGGAFSLPISQNKALQQAEGDAKISVTTDKHTIAPGNYLLCEGDIIEVKFPYKKEYDFRTTVAPDGNIALPFIGSMHVFGKSVDAVRTDVGTKFSTLAGDQVDPQNISAKKEYRINAGDELEVKFARNKELNEAIVVRPDGKISLVMVGAIVAENKTPERLTQELKWLYKKHIQDPDPVVIIRKYTSNRYYVDNQLVRPGVKDLDKLVISLVKYTPLQVMVGGEVNRPGVYPYRTGVTSLQAIIQAGGGKLSGEMRQVAIIRKRVGQKGEVIVLNLKSDKVDATKGADNVMAQAAGNDITLQPFDVVIVPKTRIASVIDFLGQYVFKILPPVQNSSFNFVYDLDDKKRF